MPKYVAVEITCNGLTIPTLNDKVGSSSDGHICVNGLMNLLAMIIAGNESGSVKIVTKDAATTMNTSGTGSTSTTYTFS